MQEKNYGKSNTSNSIVSSYTASQNTTTTTSVSGSNNVNESSYASQGQKTVVAVYDTASAAENAVSELRRQGFSKEEISIVSKDRNTNARRDGHYEDDITDGALTGSTIGGIGGLLLGAGALAIPGIGPIIAAGPIAGALSGALAGGVAGGLIDWGIPAEAGQRYESRLAQGNILAIVRTQATKINQAASIFNQYGANEVEIHDTNKKSV